MADTPLCFDVSISVESAIGDVWPAIAMFEMSRAVCFFTFCGNEVIDLDVRAPPGGKRPTRLYVLVPANSAFGPKPKRLK